MSSKGREIQLPNSRVMRGGVTALQYSGVYENLEFMISPVDSSLNFYFTLPSKGGEETQVAVEIPRDDLVLLLNEVVSNLPEGISITAIFEDKSA